MATATAEDGLVGRIEAAGFAGGAEYTDGAGFTGAADFTDADDFVGATVFVGAAVRVRVSPDLPAAAGRGVRER